MNNARGGVAATVFLLILGGQVPVLAVDEQPELLINAFLKDYELAFTTGNPFVLQRYDPTFQVFGPLLFSTWYDNIARSAIKLTDRSVALTSPEDWKYRVSFLKIQEDVQKDGLYTRGLAVVSMDLQFRDGRIYVLSHRVLPPKGAPPGYRSNDPRSWSVEHSLAERSLYRGLDSLREGDLKSAEAAINRAVELVEAGELPRFILGASYFSAMAYYYSAMLKAKRGNYADSSRELDLALSHQPDFPAALNLRAEIHFNEGEYDKAARLWRKSLSLFPLQSDVYEIAQLLETVAKTRDKKLRSLLLSLVDLPPARAVELLSPAVKNHPGSPVLVPLMAKAHMAGGDLEKALEVLEGSRLVGRDVEATYLAARIKLKLGRIEESLALFEKVWREETGYRDVAVFLVGIYASMGRFSEAVETLSTPRVDLGSGVTHALKGKFHLMAGRFLDGVSDLDLACQARLPSRLRSEVAYLVKRISRPTEVKH